MLKKIHYRPVSSYIVTNESSSNQDILLDDLKPPNDQTFVNYKQVFVLDDFEPSETYKNLKSSLDYSSKILDKRENLISEQQNAHLLSTSTSNEQYEILNLKNRQNNSATRCNSARLNSAASPHRQRRRSLVPPHVVASSASFKQNIQTEQDNFLLVNNINNNNNNNNNNMSQKDEVNCKNNNNEMSQNHHQSECDNIIKLKRYFDRESLRINRMNLYDKHFLMKQFYDMEKKSARADATMLLPKKNEFIKKEMEFGNNDIDHEHHIDEETILTLIMKQQAKPLNVLNDELNAQIRSELLKVGEGEKNSLLMNNQNEGLSTTGLRRVNFDDLGTNNYNIEALNTEDVNHLTSNKNLTKLNRVYANVFDLNKDDEAEEQESEKIPEIVTTTTTIEQEKEAEHLNDELKDDTETRRLYMERKEKNAQRRKSSIFLQPNNLNDIMKMSEKERKMSLIESSKDLMQIKSIKLEEAGGGASRSGSTSLFNGRKHSIVSSIRSNRNGSFNLGNKLQGFNENFSADQNKNSMTLDIRLYNPENDLPIINNNQNQNSIHTIDLLTNSEGNFLIFNS